MVSYEALKRLFLWRHSVFGMRWQVVCWKFTAVSEEPGTLIFRMETEGGLLYWGP